MKIIFLASCATPLVVKTPNVTKPVFLGGSCNQNSSAVLAEHKEGYSSDGNQSQSRTEGEETNLEMKIIAADPEDKMKTFINEIEFGSFSYLIFVAPGKKYWVNTRFSQCDKAVNK